MSHRSDVAERVGVGEAQVVDERRVVDVGIEVDDVQRFLVLVPPDDRVGDGVVAAEDHRQRPPGEDRPGEVGRVVERALHVGGPHVDVADVGDGPVRHLVGEVGATGFRVVEPGVGGGEAQGMLSNRARPHARTREERRAFVERNPVDGDVGVERVEVRFDSRAQERGDPDERAVELDSGASAARCHGGVLQFLSPQVSPTCSVARGQRQTGTSARYGAPTSMPVASARSMRFRPGTLYGTIMPPDCMMFQEEPTSP